MAEKKADGCEVGNTLLEAESDDVLELDEVWTFILYRNNKRWLWVMDSLMSKNPSDCGLYLR
jgi:hypothetical protein